MVPRKREMVERLYHATSCSTTLALSPLSRPRPARSDSQPAGDGSGGADDAVAQVPSVCKLVKVLAREEQAVKQRLRQWTKPDTHSLVLSAALDLTLCSGRKAHPFLNYSRQTAVRSKEKRNTPARRSARGGV